MSRLFLVLALPAFLVLSAACANNAELEERLEALEEKQEVTNTSIEQTRDAIDELKSEVSAVGDQTSNNGDSIGLLNAQIENLIDDLSELNTRAISDSDAVEDLATGMEESIAEIHSSVLSSNLSSGSLPIFNRNLSVNEANQLFGDCLIGRVEDLMGTMASMFGKSLADEFPVEDLTGFSDGELTSVEEIAFMGAFFGCWTIGASSSFDVDVTENEVALPSFDTNLTENEVEQVIYDCLWDRMDVWAERTLEEWQFIDAEIIERFLQPVPEINTSLFTRKEMISIWGSLLGCWSMDGQ